MAWNSGNLWCHLSFSLDLWQFSATGSSSLPPMLQFSSGMSPQSSCVEDVPSVVLVGVGVDLKRWSPMGGLWVTG